MKASIDGEVPVHSKAILADRPGRFEGEGHECEEILSAPETALAHLLEDLKGGLFQEDSGLRPDPAQGNGVDA